MWEDKDETIRLLKIQVSELEKMLYEACDMVFEHGMITDVSEFGEEINNWYDKQQPIQSAREAKEIETAKAKLTDREKKLLRIT